MTVPLVPLADLIAELRTQPTTIAAQAAADRLEEMDRDNEALGHEADLLTGELRRVKHALAADNLAGMRQRLIDATDVYDPRDDYLMAAANTIYEATR